MARSIAVVHGVAIRPGVSRNGRLYTSEHIRGAVSRAQSRVLDGTATVRDLDETQPMAQRTHHGAEDDSTAIVGRLTSLTLGDDGSARYTAELADTPAAHTILNLIDTSDGSPPFLKGVSIRGAWLGEVRQVNHDGRVVETGDDLDIDGLDYTQRPGVVGAGVDKVERLDTERVSRETDDAGRHLIYESVPEARVSTVEEKGAPALKGGKPAAAPTKAPTGSYADPGYQDDRAKRYPLDTAKHARAAWSYINQKSNASKYTAAQLKRIKGRIKSALRKFGVKITDEGWLIDPVVEITETELAEYYLDSSSGGSYEIRLTNGPTTISMCSYRIDPADLEIIGRAAMAGACQALAALDPDMDADIDIGDSGDGTESTDETASTINEAGQAADPNPKEAPDVSEPTTPAVEPQTPTAPATPAAPEPTPTPPTEPQTPAEPAPDNRAQLPGVTLSNDQFQALLGALKPPATAGAPAETAPGAAAPAVTETGKPAEPAPVTETQEQMIARLVAEGVKAALPLAVQEHVQSAGVPARKGLVRAVAEDAADTDTELTDLGIPSDWPQKPLHQYSEAERRKYFGPSLEQYVLGSRSDI